MGYLEHTLSHPIHTEPCQYIQWQPYSPRYYNCQSNRPTCQALEDRLPGKANVHLTLNSSHGQDITPPSTFGYCSVLEDLHMHVYVLNGDR